jgi:hypothetical protein
VRETLRKAAKLIGPGQRRRWVFLVVLAVTVSGFEMVGAILVYLLVDLASDPTAPATFRFRRHRSPLS